MPRTVFIIPSDSDVEDYLEQAAAAGAGEVVVGVPPAWAAVVDVSRLPTVYVEDGTSPGPVDEPGPVVTPEPDPEPAPDVVTRDEFNALMTMVFELMGVEAA